MKKQRMFLRMEQWIQTHDKFYSSILKNVLSLIHNISLYIQAFESNKHFDWLNPTV